MIPGGVVVTRAARPPIRDICNAAVCAGLPQRAEQAAPARHLKKIVLRM